MNPRIWMLGPIHRHVSIRCIFPHLGLRDICGRNGLLLDWRGRFAHSTLRPRMVRRLFMFFCTNCGRCYSFRRSSLCVFANPRNWIPRWGRWCFRVRCMLPHLRLRSICRRGWLLLDRRTRLSDRTRRWRRCRFCRNGLYVFMNPRRRIPRRCRWFFCIRCMLPYLGLRCIYRKSRFLLNRRNRFTHRMLRC